MLEHYLLVFFIAMVPVVELRGAIPIGLGLGLDVLPTYIVAVLGNMLPVPVIIAIQPVARGLVGWARMRGPAMLNRVESMAKTSTAKKAALNRPSVPSSRRRVPVMSLGFSAGPL